MPDLIRFFVSGVPKAQPRARAFARKMGDKYVARVFDDGTAEGWKSQIAIAARQSIPAQAINCAARLSIEFVMPRPKKHFRTGRWSTQLRPDAPKFHTGKPDLDNLIKAVMDALTTLRIWKDDCAVCEYGPMRKVYGDGEESGALIQVEAIKEAGGAA